MSNLVSKSQVTILKAGSLVRVKLPIFEGKLALGVVTSLQVLYIGSENPYLMVWVDMLIGGINRPFEPENLEVIPRNKNGFDQCFVADLLAA